MVGINIHMITAKPLTPHPPPTAILATSPSTPLISLSPHHHHREHRSAHLRHPLPLTINICTIMTPICPSLPSTVYIPPHKKKRNQTSPLTLFTSPSFLFSSYSFSHSPLQLCLTSRLLPTKSGWWARGLTELVNKVYLCPSVSVASSSAALPSAHDTDLYRGLDNGWHPQGEGAPSATLTHPVPLALGTLNQPPGGNISYEED